MSHPSLPVAPSSGALDPALTAAPAYPPLRSQPLGNLDRIEPQTGTQQPHLRQLGINPNHWYVVARSTEVTTQPFGVTLWKQAIALYRDSQGQVHAMEDRCPHRQVKLSDGQVRGDELECAYHGWRFNSAGQCTAIPYLSDQQRIPACQIRCYPVTEQDGFIWLFPGDPEVLQSRELRPMGVPEWDHLNYIGSVAPIDCHIHYSFLIENLMDMHHGHLHDNYQAWAEARLDSIEETGDRVHAHYQAQSYYRIDKIWSVSQLFFPSLRQLHPEPLDVSYLYPHWAASLGQDFKIYCLLCPIDETHTRAYLLHFTSLNGFPRLHKLSEGFRRAMKNLFFGSANGLLNGLIRQDVWMMEQEQQAFLSDPNRRTYEVNRALPAVQRLIRRQANVGSVPSATNSRKTDSAAIAD
ncbi:MAG TPA: aromatic ring-hydroxylating dioxygenase subunit alpha [Chroococcidiopsis sp.]